MAINLKGAGFLDDDGDILTRAGGEPAGISRAALAADAAFTGAFEPLLDWADASLQDYIYRVGPTYDIEAHLTASDGWVIRAMRPDGRRLYGTKTSTKSVGYSDDDGATWTSAETFTRRARALHILPSGEIVVACADDGQAVIIKRSTGWVANPTTATFADVHTAAVNEAGVWPDGGYGGFTDDGAGNHVWACMYGTKTNVDPGNNPGAVRLLRSDDGGATWATVFNLATWLTGQGYVPASYGYHLHGCAWDDDWDRIWLTFGDYAAGQGLAGLLYSDDLGASWSIAYTTATTGGNYQATAPWPMSGGVVLQNDGTPYDVFVLPKTGYRTFAAPTSAIAITGGSVPIGLQPSRMNRPGAPLLLPMTNFGTVTAGQSRSRVVATADGRRFYNVVLDPNAGTAGFDGISTAFGPTPDGKIVGTRPEGGVLSTYVIDPV